MEAILKKQIIRVALVMMLVLLGQSASAFAYDVTLAWNPNPEPDIAGYKLYCRTAAGSCNGSPFVLGNRTSYTVTGLNAGTYYFALKAYSTANLESPLTPEIPKTFTTIDPPPVISSVSWGDITHDGITISWTTNEPATSQVEYGTSTAYGSASPVNTNLVTNHSVRLTGLAAATSYHFRVKSRDAAGNMGQSGDSVARTLLPPPVNVSIK